MTTLPAPAVAVLTAAGAGTRLGAQVPKALVQVGGETLLHRSARGLMDAGVLEAVVVTAPQQWRDHFIAELADLGAVPAGGAAGTDAASGAGAASAADGASAAGLTSSALHPADRTDAQPAARLLIVEGSPASRQASVARGLDAALRACPDAGVILVHDAARALTPPSLVQRVVQAVRNGHDAVVPGLPVTDTVKDVEPARNAGEAEPVTATPDRSRLRAVQTPQGFATHALLAAHRHGSERATDEARAASDDAGLVEADGGQVVVVPGDPMAFKVTRPLDLALAEALLGH